MNDTLKNILIWVGVALILIVVFSSFGTQEGRHQVQQMPTSTFLGKIKTNEIKNVVFDGQDIKGVTSTGQSFRTYMPWNDPFLLDKLMSKDYDTFLSEYLKLVLELNLTPRVNSVRAFILMWLERQERMKRSLS